MTIQFHKLERAEMAALVVETLAAHGIEVVLVGGSCVCIWTDERFGSFDLDFIDLTYRRRREIKSALSEIGFVPKGATRYFEHPDSNWTIEFPTAPLAVGHEMIGSERVATIDTKLGTIRLLNPTDTVKDRLPWWYLEGDHQCWEQAADIARHHQIAWTELEKWHAGEGYTDRYPEFKNTVNHVA